MDVVYLCLFIVVLVQLFRIRQTLDDIALPVPSLGFLSDIGGVPIPSDGVCGRWDSDGEPELESAGSGEGGSPLSGGAAA